PGSVEGRVAPLEQLRPELRKMPRVVDVDLRERKQEPADAIDRRVELPITREAGERFEDGHGRSPGLPSRAGASALEVRREAGVWRHVRSVVRRGLPGTRTGEAGEAE